MSKYVIGHAHSHQSVWLIRLWFILTSRACTLKLVKLGGGTHFCVCRAPCGSGTKGFGRPIPKHILEICTNIYDDWTNRYSYSHFPSSFRPLQSLLVDGGQVFFE